MVDDAIACALALASYQILDSPQRTGSTIWCSWRHTSLMRRSRWCPS